MPKGTSAKGRRHTKSHCLCARCGHRAFHTQKKLCGACGYPNPKMRKYNWAHKSLRRKKIGTGRLSYYKRALKRRNNRRVFDALPKLIQKAIFNAKKETGKRFPPRRAFRKHVRKQINLKILKRTKRHDQLTLLMLEVKKRLASKRNDKNKDQDKEKDKDKDKTKQKQKTTVTAQAQPQQT